MAEHTPTPWFYHAGLEGDLITCDPEGVVCRTPNHPENAASWEENARFIVKAVNNHDALVKALTDTLCELTACASQLAARGLKGHPDDSVSRAQSAARQALAHVGYPSQREGS